MTIEKWRRGLFRKPSFDLTIKADNFLDWYGYPPKNSSIYKCFFLGNHLLCQLNYDLAIVALNFGIGILFPGATTQSLFDYLFANLEMVVPVVDKGGEVVADEGRGAVLGVQHHRERVVHLVRRRRDRHPLEELAVPVQPRLRGGADGGGRAVGAEPGDAAVVGGVDGVARGREVVRKHGGEKRLVWWRCSVAEGSLPCSSPPCPRPP